jgi:cytochrome P450
MLMGKRVHYVNALHQKYGPIVRIAPNEVAIADPAASKEIHSISSRYLKVHVDIGPVPNIFSMTDPKQHNIRRRLYSKGFSQASLRKHWEPAVRDVVRTAVSKIKLDARSGTADIFKWWMLMSNDIICLLTIGEGFGMLEKGEKNYHIITAVELHIGLAVRQFSSLLYFLGQLLSPLSPALDNIFSVGKQLYGYGSKAVQKVRSEKDGSASQMTFFARALEDVKADNALAANVSAELSDAEICVDAAGFQLAGSDTVAITLTFLVWCVLGQSALQTRLEQEVAGISGEVTDAACDQLPLLNAVIDETLRLHGAAPTALRRVVPSGGAMLGGYRIPEAAIVATQAYSLHRNPDIWKDPET